ncbi:MAG: sugar-transfer associated ATP-grasp domain-containing protein [Bacteroidota bacterium]
MQVSLAIQTAKAFPLAYLGIDIVIDKSLGPLVMEINVRPGLGIQLANQKGLREVLQELDFAKATTGPDKLVIPSFKLASI